MRRGRRVNLCFIAGRFSPNRQIAHSWFMDLESARARGDLSILKRKVGVKVPRIPHPDEPAITLNISRDEWQKNVLLRKQAEGEVLSEIQIATLERLCPGASNYVAPKIVVSKKGGAVPEGKRRVEDGGGAKKVQVRNEKRDFDEATRSERVLSTADKLSMSLDALTSKRRK